MPKGTVVAHGGGPIRQPTIDQFAELCGEGPMVLIPTAAKAAEHRGYRGRVRDWWLRQGFSEVVVLHARDRDEADEHFAEPLRRASCAWLSGGAQGRLEDRYVGTPVERELHALLQRGGTVGGDSAGSSIMSRVMIHHGNPDPIEGTGLGILPSLIVDQHFLVRDREPRLLTMVERHPDLVGMGIDESTALVIHGDRWKVIGDSLVRRCTADDGCINLPAGTEGRLEARGKRRLPTVRLSPVPPPRPTAASVELASNEAVEAFEALEALGEHDDPRPDFPPE